MTDASDGMTSAATGMTNAAAGINSAAEGINKAATTISGTADTPGASNYIDQAAGIMTQVSNGLSTELPAAVQQVGDPVLNCKPARSVRFFPDTVKLLVKDLQMPTQRSLQHRAL